MAGSSRCPHLLRMASQTNLPSDLVAALAGTRSSGWAPRGVRHNWKTSRRSSRCRSPSSLRTNRIPGAFADEARRRPDDRTLRSARRRGDRSARARARRRAAADPVLRGVRNRRAPAPWQAVRSLPDHSRPRVGRDRGGVWRPVAGRARRHDSRRRRRNVSRRPRDVQPLLSLSRRAAADALSVEKGVRHQLWCAGGTARRLGGSHLDEAGREVDQAAGEPCTGDVHRRWLRAGDGAARGGHGGNQAWRIGRGARRRAGRAVDRGVLLTVGCR